MSRLAKVNEFVLRFANVNGTGSASANGLVARALFRMGLPVGPKNIFPSNIQGLPTWFEIRVSEAGYTGRRGTVDLMVAMNGQTFAEDVRSVESGGYLLYDSSKPLASELRRNDINYLDVPLTEMVTREFANPRQRLLFKNIAYVGVLSALLDIEPAVVEQLLCEQFRGKEKLIPPNMKAFEMGRAAALERFACPLPMHAQRRDAIGDRILMDGNSAAGLGCVYAGATVAAWYPITPSTSLVDAFSGYCEDFRINPDGSKRYAILQAEDRDGDWRRLERRALVHRHQRSGHVADDRVPGPGLLRGNSGSAVRHSALRALHRHAHAHAAVRPAVVGLRLARRHQTCAVVPGLAQGMLPDGGASV